MDEIELTLTEAAQELGITERKLLSLANNLEIGLDILLAPHRADLKSLPSCNEPRTGSRETGAVTSESLAARYAASLEAFGFADVQHYPIPTLDEPLASHYFWMREPQRVTLDRVRVSRSEIERYRNEQQRHQKKTRIVGIVEATRAAVEALTRELKRKPNVNEVFDYWMRGFDRTGVIHEVIDAHVIWTDAGGKSHTTGSKSIAAHIRVAG